MPDADYQEIISELLPREQQSLILDTMDLELDGMRNSEIFGSYATIKRLDDLGLVDIVNGPMGREIRMTDKGFDIAKILTRKNIEQTLALQSLKSEIMDLTGQLSRAGLRDTYSSFLPKRWSQRTTPEQLSAYLDQLKAIALEHEEEIKNPRPEAG